MSHSSVKMPTDKIKQGFRDSSTGLFFNSGAKTEMLVQFSVGGRHSQPVQSVALVTESLQVEKHSTFPDFLL